jgi:hypothetical protein
MNFAHVARAHFADDHHPSVDADTHGNLLLAASAQIRGQASRSLDEVEAGQNRALGVVVVCDGIPEVSQHAIARVLMNFAAVASGALHTHLLIGKQQRAQGFWVEAPRQRRRPDDVSKQYRELAALSFAGGA